MNAIMSARRSAPRAVGVVFAAACVVLIPRIAIASDTGGGTTYRAQIGPDGTVQSVKQVSVDGSSSSFSGTLPVTMKIAHTAAGAAQTFAYHVENTFTQTQTIHYDDTAGNAHHTSVVVQLPLVAQLGVNVPKSMGAITAPNAAVTEGIDGTRHVLWNLVLFTPVGSAVQDVTLTTAANGTPVAELAAASVDPNSAQGLSAATQNATANYQQDDFWAGFLSGANGGLTQLSSGAGQLIAGMQKILGGLSTLHSKLAAGVSGTKQLDAGGRQAYLGTKALRDGVGLLAAGAGKLDSGMAKIHSGLGTGPKQLTGGLKAVHDGSTKLTAGLGQVSGGLDGLSSGLGTLNTGAGSLSTGVGQISAGLNQLADPTTGLPAAVTGINQLIAGTQALVAGIGSDGDSGTLLNGVVQVQGGLSQLETGIQQSAGCGADVLGKLLAGVAAPVADQCISGGTFPPVTAISDPTTVAILGGLVSQFQAVANGTDPTLQAGFGQLSGGLQQIHDGLSHPVGAAGPSDQGGVKQGVQAVEAGLNQLLTGVSAASTGVGQLAAGANAAATGASQLAAGASTAFAGSHLLDVGAASAYTGSKALTAGAGKLLAGSRQLLTGTGAALSGTNKIFLGLTLAYGKSAPLVPGLKRISGGIHQSATQLPQAVSGTKQLLDGQTQTVAGAQKIAGGLTQIHSSATGPLAAQLGQASQNSHQTLAVLQAIANLGSQGPGGAGASYVLSQASNAFGLTASSTPAKHGSSHTGRNVGIGLGGAALLLGGIGGGFAMGRTRRRAHAA